MLNHDREQLVYIMREIEGKSYARIASALNTTDSNVYDLTKSDYYKHLLDTNWKPNYVNPKHLPPKPTTQSHVVHHKHIKL